MLGLIKLAVGVSSPEELIQRQKMSENLYPHPDYGPVPVVYTRFFPKRADELLNGGSLYRVIGGLIVCRQTILDIKSGTRPDGRESTLICVSPELIRTNPMTMRPFQGWRYLEGKDCPPDSAFQSCSELPGTLQKKLIMLGLASLFFCLVSLNTAIL